MCGASSWRYLVVRERGDPHEEAGQRLHRTFPAMWYDLFALVYDPALEALYAPYRPLAVDALRLAPGATVLDVPCGTGQSFNALTEAVGPSGRVVGADASRGMLRRAERRVEREAWTTVSLLHRSVHDLSPDALREAGVHEEADGVLCALGLTAFPDWERAFSTFWGLLRPGGRLVILDVHAETRTLQTRSVELIARADLSRRVWEPLEAAASDFERRPLDADPKKMGGTLFLASGTKP